jgi:hypothetical protein
MDMKSIFRNVEIFTHKKKKKKKIKEEIFLWRKLLNLQEYSICQNEIFKIN